MDSLVDADHPDTWPQNVMAWVRDVSEILKGSTPHTSDLILPNDDDEDQFRSLFSGRLVRAYHATRLLPHEVAGIRRDGLRPLSEEMLRDRLAAAQHAGYLAPSEVKELFAGQTARESNRAGQVCLFLSEEPMGDKWSGLWNLLSMWGGEAIYGDNISLRDRLRTLGVPTIVVAAVDLSPGWQTHQVWPGLAVAFIGRFLELDAGGASIHYNAPIPPEHVLSIWQPGDSDYERYSGPAN